MPRLCVALLLAVLAAAVAALTGGETEVRAQAPNPAPPPEGTRIASVRAYQNGDWVIPGETPQTVGAALAELEPSYVGSIIRFKAGAKIKGAEVEAWNTITGLIRAANPSAQFDIELNGLEFKKPGEVEAMMNKIRARFDNEGWFFDFYTPAAKKYPKAMAAAVANATANGEWIGGNAFGIAKNPVIPTGTDFLAVQDTKFRINLKAVQELAQKLPVFFHLGNSPGFPSSDGCIFTEQYSTAKRAQYVTRRADQQAANDFRFAYPVFFPECARNRGTPQVKIFAYNALHDEPMIHTISQLMEQYD